MKRFKDLRPEKIRLGFTDKMRLNDVGDYYFKDDKYYILAYSQLNETSRWAVLLHEFVEALLILAYDLTPEDLDKIDAGQEAPKEKKKAYNKAHKVALKIEKLFIKALGESWRKHDRYVRSVEVNYCEEETS